MIDKVQKLIDGKQHPTSCKENIKYISCFDELLTLNVINTVLQLSYSKKKGLSDVE